MKLQLRLSIFAGLLVVSIWMAMGTPVYIENCSPTAVACGDYVSEQWIYEEGCRDRQERNKCRDGTPWFYNLNYRIKRTRIDKYYQNGTRHLCTAWNEDGACCNSINESACPDSSCTL